MSDESMNQAVPAQDKTPEPSDAPLEAVAPTQEAGTPEAGEAAAGEAGDTEGPGGGPGKAARELAGVQARLEKAEKEAEETKDRLLRTAAEYDNFRKRSAREASQKFNDGVSHAVSQLLPILDTLEMAAAAPCGDEAYRKGVVLTLEKAAEAMEKLGLAEIEAQDQPFDPETMNAVQQVPAQEGQESGAVAQVFQKGYRLGDKIVRHATVVVTE